MQDTNDNADCLLSRLITKTDADCKRAAAWRTTVIGSSVTVCVGKDGRRCAVGEAFGAEVGVVAVENKLLLSGTR